MRHGGLIGDVQALQAQVNHHHAQHKPAQVCAAPPQHGPGQQQGQRPNRAADAAQPLVHQSARLRGYQRTGSARQANHADLPIIQPQRAAGQLQRHGGKQHADRGKGQSADQRALAQTALAAQQLPHAGKHLGITDGAGVARCRQRLPQPQRHHRHHQRRALVHGLPAPGV